MPIFWLALLLISLFAVELGWLPAGGMADPRAGPFLDAVQNIRFALPVATLALVNIGVYTRFMRGAMIETLRQDYIRTARAKGAAERAPCCWATPSASRAPRADDPRPPFGALFSGAMITETMFAWPGMGADLPGIQTNDFNLALVACCCDLHHAGNPGRTSRNG